MDVIRAVVDQRANFTARLTVPPFEDAMPFITLHCPRTLASDFVTKRNKIRWQKPTPERLCPLYIRRRPKLEALRQGAQSPHSSFSPVRPCPQIPQDIFVKTILRPSNSSRPRQARDNCHREFPHLYRFATLAGSKAVQSVDTQSC